MEVLNRNDFYHWCLLAFLQHPDATLLRARAADTFVDLLPVIPPEEAFSMKFVIDNMKKENEKEQECETSPKEDLADVDDALVRELEERMNYVYPYRALSETLSKRSASHLGEKPFSAEYFAETRPESLSSHGMTPAERGTCLHKFMQYADFSAASNDIESEKAQLVEKGFLLQEEADVIDPAVAETFFSSDMALRLQKSPKVYREHKFAILLPAGQFDPSLSGDAALEKVLIQGIVDCAFEEDNSLVLLDYKTDRVKNAEDLRERYRDQLTLYRTALEETMGLPVKEIDLFSFHLGEVVPLP